MNNFSCYVAGNFFLTARALIGYVEVTLQLIMKLFPAKISERATLQIYDVKGNSALLLANGDLKQRRRGRQRERQKSNRLD